MKLIYLADIRLPTEKAHGIQIMKMCEAFAAEGLEVELIVPNRRNVISKDPFVFYSVRRNFKIRKIPSIDFNFLNFKHLQFFIQFISFLVSARIVLFFEKYDILYGRDAFYSNFFRNVSVEVHSIAKNFNYFYVKSLNRAKTILVLTSYIKDRLIKSGLNGKRITIAPDAVDLKDFEQKSEKERARKEVGLPLDVKIILYTGHLYGWKGVNTLAESAKSFGKNELFVFVGGTAQDIDLFKKKYADVKNILVVGQKPHSEIPLYLASADVLVLPNSGKEDISRFYTSPMKLFEYMAAGKPIVASSLPSIREILNETNAIFFEPDNSSSLAGSIRKVLGDEGLGRRISFQSLDDVRKYTWENRAKNIIDFINKNE
jgi:glycosyltransferase involved in cell wall biosynthesis